MRVEEDYYKAIRISQEQYLCGMSHMLCNGCSTKRRKNCNFCDRLYKMYNVEIAIYDFMVSLENKQ